MIVIDKCGDNLMIKAKKERSWGIDDGEDFR